MSYTLKALNEVKNNEVTHCIKCGCMGEYKNDEGEYFILTGTSAVVEKSALTSDRTCHCATCWLNGGCESLVERSNRIYLSELTREVLEKGFEPAKNADKELENLSENDKEYVAIVERTDSELKQELKKLLNDIIVV